MLGLRGVRLGVHIPDLTSMQARAIFEAACDVVEEGIDVHPEVMIPLTSHVEELRRQRAIVAEEAAAVSEERGIDLDWRVRHHDRGAPGRPDRRPRSPRWPSSSPSGPTTSPR